MPQVICPVHTGKLRHFGAVQCGMDLCVLKCVPALQSMICFLIGTDDNWEERQVPTNSVRACPSPPNWHKFPARPIWHAFLSWFIHQHFFSLESSFLWERMLIYDLLLSFFYSCCIKKYQNNQNVCSYEDLQNIILT